MKIEVKPWGATQSWQVWVGTTSVGLIEPQGDTFRIYGFRKPRATIEAAAIDLVWRRIRRLLGEAATLSAMFDAGGPDVVIDRLGTDALGSKDVTSESQRSKQ